MIGPRRSTAVLTILGGALIAAACAAPGPTASITPSAAPSATASPSPPGVTAEASDTAAIEVDDALLDLLPDEVAGVRLEPDRETAADVARDPTLAVDVDRIAVATAFGPLATDGAADYAVVTVAGLRPGAFSDPFFRAWRDTFDAAVCEQAGGVSGHAESTIGERTVWIGTCAGGVHTYHATLRDDSVIVSLQGSGPGRYGEQVMAGLTE